MSIGVKINRELIGNLIILLCDKCSPLSHTKLLKLLYIIDEDAIKDSGIPITWLDYKVWKFGPVDPAIFYIENNFGDYIKINRVDGYNGNVNSHIKPKKSFDDSKFSDYDMRIIEKVIEKYGDKKAKELVDLTHKPGSPWDIAKKENTIDFSIANISEISIDMSRIIKGDEEKYANYREAEDIAIFRSALI